MTTLDLMDLATWRPSGLDALRLRVKVADRRLDEMLEEKRRRDAIEAMRASGFTGTAEALDSIFKEAK